MLPLLQLVHLGGPICVNVQLVESIRHNAITATQNLGFHRVLLAASRHNGRFAHFEERMRLIGEQLLQPLRVLSLRSAARYQSRLLIGTRVSPGQMSVMATFHHFANLDVIVCHFRQFATIRLSFATCGSACSIVLESSSRPSVVVISPGNSFRAASMASICGTLAFIFRQILRGNFGIPPIAGSGRISMRRLLGLARIV